MVDACYFNLSIRMMAAPRTTCLRRPDRFLKVPGRRWEDRRVFPKRLPPMPESARPPAVLKFWHDAGRQKWRKKDPVFDTAFRERFFEARQAAARREPARRMDG